MTGQPHDDGAAGRIAAYLDAYRAAWSAQFDDWATHSLDSIGDDELTIVDLREVLRELDEARTELDAYAQRESADAAAGSYALRAETAEAERDEARAIARVLVHQNLGVVAATVECDVHLSIGPLPGWLTADQTGGSTDAEPTQPPELMLTLVDGTFQQPARIQAHCHGHDPKQLFGEWDAPDDEASEVAYVTGLKAAAERHLREAHPEVSTDV